MPKLENIDQYPSAIRKKRYLILSRGNIVNGTVRTDSREKLFCQSVGAMSDRRLPRAATWEILKPI
jgi:hypothetical protein